MKNVYLVLRSLAVVLTLSLIAPISAYAEEDESYSGKIDAVDLANRMVLVNDLPLKVNDNLVVYSSRGSKLNRYHLRVDQEVRVEIEYDSKSDAEYAKTIYILK